MSLRAAGNFPGAKSARLWPSAGSWSRPGAVAASLPACLACWVDAARPAIGHGRRVGSPPPAPSVAPSSRHRAGHWLSSPWAVFGAAGGPSLPRFRPASRVGPMLQARPPSAPSATASKSAHHRLRCRGLCPAATGPAIGCPAPEGLSSRQGAVAASLPACLASGLPRGSGRCCKAGRRQPRRPRPAGRLTTACVVGGSVQPPPGRPLAAQPRGGLWRGRRPSLPRFRPASRVGPMLQARSPTAASATAGGRRCLASGLPRGAGRCCKAGRPPRRRPRPAGRLTTASAVGGSVSRHRASHWLPSPWAVFGTAGGHRCLASGLPHGSGRCCKPGRRQRRRPRPAGRLTTASAVGGSVQPAPRPPFTAQPISDLSSKASKTRFRPEVPLPSSDAANTIRCDPKPAGQFREPSLSAWAERVPVTSQVLPGCQGSTTPIDFHRMDGYD